MSAGTGTTAEIPAGTAAPAGIAAPAGAAGAANARPVGGEVARGMLWLLAQSLTTRAASFVFQIAIAALLVPADLGEVALALTISGIATNVVGFGIDEVLLQRQARMRLWYRTALALGLGLGLLGGAVLAAVAPLLARLYGTADLAKLLTILAVTLPLSTLATVPSVVIRTRLDFRFLALYSTLEGLALQVVTVALAILGAGAYSFVVPTAFFAVLKAVVFWRYAGVRPAGRAHPARLRRLASRGSLVAGSRLMCELMGQGDYVVLGLLAAPHVVGLYYFAFRLAVMPVHTLAGNFQSVLFPALATLSREPERQARAAFDSARTLAFVVVPLCFLQAALADPLLRLVFGAKWEGAILPAEILSLGLPFDAAGWITGALLSARGEFRRFLAWAAFSVPIFLAAAALGAWLGGAAGTAAAVSLYFVFAPASLAIAVFRTGRTIAEIATGLYLAPGAVGVLAVGPAWLVAGALPLAGLSPAGTDLARCAATVLVAAAVGLPLTRVVAPDVVARLSERLLSILRERFGGLGPAKT